MRYGIALVLTFVLIGCGAVASQTQRTVQPEAATRQSEPAPPRSVLKTECLQITAPSGWRITKSETHRPTAEQQADAENPGRPFSAVTIASPHDELISVVHPHGDPGVAFEMFEGTMLQMFMMSVSAADNDQIRQMQVTEPQDMFNEPGAISFSAYQLTANGTETHGWFATVLLREGDESSRVMVSTSVPPAEGEDFSLEVVEIVRSLRFTCER